MKYVLADISRLDIRLFYNDGHGTRSFLPWGNGPVPLAISCVNGDYYVGQTALQYRREGREEVFDHLFDWIRKDASCGTLKARDFIPKALKLYMEEMSRDVFYCNLNDVMSEICLVLFFSNDILQPEMDRVINGVAMQGFSKVISELHPSQSVRFFLSSRKNDWRQEKNAMIVMSDNETLSIKCISLFDGSLIYEKNFQGRGRDPRFDWAVNQIWGSVCSQTYCKIETERPIIEEALLKFLVGSNMELTSIRLSDGGDYSIFLNHAVYDNYCPPNGQELISIISSVVEEANLEYATTGIVLQGYCRNNKFFHDSFSSFDPISDETKDCERDIHNQMLRDIVDGKEWKFVGRSGGGETTKGNDFVIIAGSNNGEFGTVQGGGAFPNNKMITLIASPQNGYRFLNWTENGNEVSKDESYSFAVTGNRALTANFAAEDLHRKFNMQSSVETIGRFARRTKKLIVTVEILEDNALPFDCMFTIDSRNFKTYKPDDSFCVECKRGTKGKVQFGPFDLPIAGIGNASVLYAHLWPIDRNLSPNLFRNNHLTIQV